MTLKNLARSIDQFFSRLQIYVPSHIVDCYVEHQWNKFCQLTKYIAKPVSTLFALTTLYIKDLINKQLENELELLFLNGTNRSAGPTVAFKLALHM